MVTFSAYVNPRTDWCHSVVRILSMIDVGSRDNAMAYILNDAAVPAWLEAKLTSSMFMIIPIPQTHTSQLRYITCCIL